MQGEIRVGTASWTDPGFVARWYPKRLPASQRLSWYADRFDLVELNSSFYAVPTRAQVQKWCRETPDDFVFDVKLHRLLSRHSTKLEMLPPEFRKLAKASKGIVQLTPDLEDAMVKKFLAEISPLRDAGKLGALLLQLSPSFRPKTDALHDLDRLLERLEGLTVAVELRNRDWVVGDQRAKTLDFFTTRQISLVSVDAPRSEHFMVMPSEDYLTSPISYLRLHGRNGQGYIRGRSVAERFNYLYSDEETEGIAQRVIGLAGRADPVHVVYNNNAEDYAPRNAQQLVKVLERASAKTRHKLSRSTLELGLNDAKASE
jgi:uncharacterized protein YecE (DUF72 family)